MPQRLLIVGSGEGKKIDIGGLGVDFKIWGETTGGQLSIVEHPMEAGRLVPPHVHHGEDELSYVLEGRFGVRVGDEVSEVGPGSYVFKPREVPHTFWNPGPAPARLIEIIWPAGFERFFEALGEIVGTAASVEDLEARRAELAHKHAVDILPDWIDQLKSSYGLRLLGEP